MAGHSRIEWTETTWNPMVGCSKISPGCGLPRFAGDRPGGCYAIRMATRLQHLPAYAGTVHTTETGQDWTGTVHSLPERLHQPLSWRTPQMVFLNSMSDIGHEAISDEFLAAVWATVFWTSPAAQALPARAKATHTYQILTKRPARMRTWLRAWSDPQQRRDMLALAADKGWATPSDVEHADAMPAVLPNVWLGTSIELDDYTLRADHLRRAPAAIRFLSLEPLLGPLPTLNLDGIDWVIAGGESGPGFRPIDLDWVRDIRDQCLQRDVKFFFKQVGGLRPKSGGRDLDGRTWDQMPIPAAVAR
jgi:protein gp37